MTKKPYWKKRGIGLEQACADLRRLKTPTLYAGVLEGSKYFNGLSVAQVAYWMEYGTSTAPARSFMRSAFYAKKKEWIKNTLKAIEKSGLINNPNVTVDAFYLLGPQVQADIRAEIDSNIPPPLRPETIIQKQDQLKKKGAPGSPIDPDAFINQGIALIRSGTLRREIDYNVDEGGNINA